jgi:ubiquinone/menaquinone biosynthesis C-methylase UbiE
LRFRENFVLERFFPVGMSDDVQEFYDKWSDIYDVFSSNPLVQDWRKSSIRNLQLKGDETVVDVGCGTGANTPILQKEVPDGRVVCLDISQDSLRKVMERIESNNYSNVDTLMADGQRIPLSDVDVIYASFSVGMFPNAQKTVNHWIDIVGVGGKIGMLNVVKNNKGGISSLVNKPVQVFTGMTTPASIEDKLRLSYSGDALDSLDRKVRNAQNKISKNGGVIDREDFFGGCVSSISIQIE